MRAFFSREIEPLSTSHDHCVEVHMSARSHSVRHESVSEGGSPTTLLARRRDDLAGLQHGFRFRLGSNL